MAHDIACQLDPVLFARAAGVEPDPWQAALLREQPKRALLCCSRQSGKTTITALLATHVATYSPGAPVVIVSPSQRQSAEMLRTVKGLLSALGDSAPATISESVLKIELANGSRIMALPGTERTIRGIAGVQLVIVDEGARVEDELLTAVRPMLATTNGSLLLLSTPAGKRGAFYELFHNGDPAWHRVRVPASDCPRISREFLASELKELGAMRYSEEYELAFVDSLENAFPTTVIDAAFTSEIQPLWN